MDENNFDKMEKVVDKCRNVWYYYKVAVATNQINNLK